MPDQRDDAADPQRQRVAAAINELLAARTQEIETRRNYHRAVTRVHEAIRTAYDEHVPVSVMATMTGLSKSRLLQIRREPPGVSGRKEAEPDDDGVA